MYDLERLGGVLSKTRDIVFMKVLAPRPVPKPVAPNQLAAPLVESVAAEVKPSLQLPNLQRPNVHLKLRLNLHLH